MTGGGPVELTAGVARDLASLRRLFGNAYQFSVHRGGKWRATRADDGQRLEAPTAQKLREKVRANYQERPVPRTGTAP